MKTTKIQVKMVSIMIIFTLALSPMTVSATESGNSLEITAPESIEVGESEVTQAEEQDTEEKQEEESKNITNLTDDQTSEGILETEETLDTEDIIVNEETESEQDSTVNVTMVGRASDLNADVQIYATISQLFPDPKFAIAIASKLNLTVDDYVDNSDLEWIKSLSANRYGIESIQGIEYLTNLVSLSLRDNKISDLSPLENLIHLNYIVLGSNQVIDISPLENLTNLTYLNLASNQITDISNLELLTNLETLYLSDNQIVDIDILKNFTNLSLFGLGYNQVSDVSALANLSNLDYLDLSFNVISDISPLGNLVSLSTLFLDGNQISDPSSLGTLTNLSYLSLAFNQISDLKGLEGLSNLQSIDLYQNQISDISILENLNLYYASVEGQAITLPPAVITGTSLTIQNPIVGHSDTTIIDGITPSGSYDEGADEITFTDLSESGEASFNFNQTTEGDTYIAFEGIVTQPYALKVDVTSINLNKSKLSFSGKSENETLIAAILPENATYKTITWTTGNNKVATVDSNGKVTAVGNGTTYIVAKADDNNLTAVCKVTVACRDEDINIPENSTDNDSTNSHGTYTVTFESNGGTLVDRQIVAHTDMVTKPVAPIREGYIFADWYIDNSTFESKWNFDTDIMTGDITLYAKWTKTSEPAKPTEPDIPPTADNNNIVLWGYMLFISLAAMGFLPYITSKKRAK